MVLATVVLGHELTYLLAHGPSGYGAAMDEAGHGRYWLTYALVVGAIGTALTAVVAMQLIRLQRLAAGLTPDARGVDNVGPIQFLRLMGCLWLKTGTSAALVYLVQENLESVTAGLPLPGLAVFAGDHVIALPLIVLVGLAVAAIGSLVAWRRGALLRRLREAAAGLRRRAPRFARDSGIPVAICCGVGSANGVRAPPLVGSRAA